MGRDGYIIDLGLLDYQKAWDIQHQLWSRRVGEELPDLLLFLEHPHVITLGRRGNRSHLIASPAVLESMKIPLFHVERGGDVTYHGPGQIVIYPIINLKDYGYRLVRYVTQLEEVILSGLKDFGIIGRRDSLNRGVWVDGEKIASVGVAIKRWVSFHGASLNYETDLKYFDLINPCGLEGIKMTSMAKILGTEVPRDRLVDRIGFHFMQIFERNWGKKKLEDLVVMSREGGTGFQPVTSFKISKRNLPHWQEPNRVYFLTWRCLKEQFLSPEERQITLDSIRYWDRQKWIVHAAVVMPDHVHVLGQPLTKEEAGTYDLGEIIHSVKSFSAHRINQQRNNRGSVWQDERFDRIVRNEVEFNEKWEYIRTNPVKKGLSENPEDYPWLYQISL